jgi:hypothetical protein
MGIDLGSAELDVPPFAGIRSENGVTELRVRTRFATWLKRSLWALPALLVCVPIILVALSAFAPVWCFIACCIAGGVVMFATLIVGASFLLAAQMTGEIIVDDKALHVKDRATYQVPLDRIRAIRHVRSTGRYIDIDSAAASPRDLMHRRRKGWLEVEVPEGRLRFFSTWGEREIEWLVANARRLCLPLSPDVTAVVPPKTADGAEDDVVYSSRLYGNKRRLALAAGMIIGLVVSCVAGYLLYAGLSTSNWPHVTGHVVHSLYEETHEDRNSSYRAEIRYAYKVFDATYTNDDIGYGRDAPDQIVKQLISEHPNGSAITVYYNPTHPGESVVIPGAGWIHWLLFGWGMFVLFLTLPFTFRRTTATQDALAPLYYQGAPAKGNKQFDTLAATLRWTTPAVAYEQGLRAARRQWFWMTVRVATLCCLVVWAAHYWLAARFPPAFPWSRVAAMIIPLHVLPFAAMFLYLCLGRFKPGSYAIGLDGISVPSKEHPLVRWEQITSFTLGHDPDAPEYQVLRLHPRDGHTRSITLPQGETGESIIRFVAARVPESPPPPKARPVTLRDWIAGLLVAAVTIVAGGELLKAYLPALRGHSAAQLIFIAGLLFGPGTWLALAMRKRRALAAILPIAAMTNLIGTIGLITYAMLRLAMQGK